MPFVEWSLLSKYKETKTIAGRIACAYRVFRDIVAPQTNLNSNKQQSMITNINVGDLISESRTAGK